LEYRTTKAHGTILSGIGTVIQGDQSLQDLNSRRASRRVSFLVHAVRLVRRHMKFLLLFRLSGKVPVCGGAAIPDCVPFEGYRNRWRGSVLVSSEEQIAANLMVHT
jgi:hypothetical protein